MGYRQWQDVQAMPVQQKSDALFLSWFAHNEGDPIIDHHPLDQLQARSQKRALRIGLACLYDTAGYKKTARSYYLRMLGGHPIYNMGKNIYQHHVVLVRHARCFYLIKCAQDNSYFVAQVIHGSVGNGAFHCYAAVIDTIDAGSA